MITHQIIPWFTFTFYYFFFTPVNKRNPLPKGVLKANKLVMFLCRAAARLGACPLCLSGKPTALRQSIWRAWTLQDRFPRWWAGESIAPRWRKACRWVWPAMGVEEGKHLQGISWWALPYAIVVNQNPESFVALLHQTVWQIQSVSWAIALLPFLSHNTTQECSFKGYLMVNGQAYCMYSGGWKLMLSLDFSTVLHKYDLKHH